MPLLDLDLVLEAYPANGRDDLSVCLLLPTADPPLLPAVHLDDFTATRTRQLEYLLAKHLWGTRRWREAFHRCIDAETLVHKPSMAPLALGNKRSFTVAFDGDKTAEMQRRPAGPAGLKSAENDAGAEAVQNDLTVEDLDLQYEKEYALARLQQEEELQAVLSRQLHASRHLVAGRTTHADGHTWRSLAWQGLLSHSLKTSKRINSVPLGSIQVVARTSNHPPLPSQLNKIEINKIVNFDFATNVKNILWLSDLCKGPMPKFVLRAEADNWSTEFAKLVESSIHARKAQVADLNDITGKSPRQLVMIPLVFVQRPINAHRNLARLLDRPLHSFLAILRNAPAVPNDGAYAESWNFVPNPLYQLPVAVFANPSAKYAANIPFYASRTNRIYTANFNYNAHRTKIDFCFDRVASPRSKTSTTPPVSFVPRDPAVLSQLKPNSPSSTLPPLALVNPFPIPPMEVPPVPASAAPSQDPNATLLAKILSDLQDKEGRGGESVQIVAALQSMVARKQPEAKDPRLPPTGE
ncbi:hypothetical protein HDU87_003789 [Geranomyces variabilis]|uniref:Uncharacterized protein n=1 Tax=Geranomyces variabilis TaxID=109894 RepID=A0AAD5TLH7_9FUNG|nr:hypothetical protein HDU87_003789 [Geranomyces variabilis]